MISCIHDDSKSSCFLYLLSHNQFEYYHNHIMYCTENARSWKNLQSTCTQHLWYAVFTMIRSRPVSCTYCHIIDLSITTITLCIAQKMQEAERIYNHRVYNVVATLYSRWFEVVRFLVPTDTKSIWVLPQSHYVLHRKCKKLKESSIIMYTTSVLYAVFAMIRSRPVSCTYCDKINLSLTTITLCIAQKM